MKKDLLCPSAQSGMADAVVFGIVTGTETKPKVTWLERPVPLTDELKARTGDVEPERVFRIAAGCEESRCGHWAEGRCSLVQRVVSILPEDPEGLPSCQLRHRCRWFQQEGKAACLRCPLVITHTYDPPEEYRRTAGVEW